MRLWLVQEESGSPGEGQEPACFLECDSGYGVTGPKDNTGKHRLETGEGQVPGFRLSVEIGMMYGYFWE